MLDATEGIDLSNLEEVHFDVTECFGDMKRRVKNRGIDPDTAPFRFVEIVCEEEKRYELPTAWKNQQDLGAPLESAAIPAFQEWMKALVVPVLSKLWKDESSILVGRSSFIVTQPGSQPYQWSHECHDEGGIFRAFLPLQDLTQEMGPTEVWPKSHMPEASHSDPFLPLLRRGQLMVMDQRMLYQYLPNEAKQEWAMGHVTFQKENCSELSVRDALTLEFD